MKLLLTFLILAISSIPIAAEDVLRLTKTPYEVLLCSVNFQVGSDTITLDSVQAYNYPTNTTAQPSIIASSPIPAVLSPPNATTIAFAVQGGNPNTTYTVSVRAIDTTNGNHMEGRIVLNVTY